MMMLQNCDHIPIINTKRRRDNNDIINFIMVSKKKRRVMIEDTEFDIETKYVPIKLIGEGSYGVVCSSINTVTNEKVAIKKITNVLKDSEEALKVLRELKILRHARHGNVISLKDVMVPSANCEDIYLVFELMHRDLESIIYSRESLSHDHIKYFMFQLLNGLTHLHMADIIHCDLKPANLLVNEDSTLKICDFGLSRTTDEYDNAETNHIGSMWYRAPELLLNCDTYGTPLDIWSVGCIFAELLGRQVLFSGTDTDDHINQIIRILGTQPEANLKFVTDWDAIELLKAMPYEAGLNIWSFFPNAELSAIDLLKKMLVFDPDKRITAKEALKHPYLSDYYEPEMIEPAPYPCEIDVDSDIAPDKIQNMIWNELILYHPKTAPYR